MADPRRHTRLASNDEYNIHEHLISPHESRPIMDTDSEEEFGSTSLSHPSSPTGPLPPRPLLPVSATVVTVRHLAEARRWDWMREVLDGWRETERIPTRPDVPGTFPPVPSLTGEPVHHTIPVLVARVYTLEQQLRRLEPSDTETEDEEIHDPEVTRLQHQLEDSERRITQLEGQMDAMRREIVALRADRDQLRETTLYATRLVDRLEGLCGRLR